MSSNSIFLLKPSFQFSTQHHHRHHHHHHLLLKPKTPFSKPIFSPYYPKYPPPLSSTRIHSSTTPITKNSSNTKKNETLRFLQPFLISNRKPIILGWLCSAISVFSLSQLVSRLGKFSNTAIDGPQLRSQGLILLCLVAARLVSGYGQHALLWDAALKTVYEVRVHVFERVLERELGYFEGREGGASAGDIAYRITAEASDVADTVYSVLNTIVPSTLQLSAMMAQMIVISPVLSLISFTVIPCMSLFVAYLGQELRKISREAHLSIAALSAYLNEMLPAVFFVKANNAELCESARFKRLAQIDYHAKLNKRRMKAAIPQVIQAIYYGTLSILCAGSLLISRGSFDGHSFISFVTSLLFSIEPIQDVGKAYNEWRQGEPAVERLHDMTKFKDKVVEKPDAVELGHIMGELKFRDVSFKYNDDMPHVLNGLNLNIRAGEIVALVGPSGGGKTTLVKLLLRLYNPVSGSILIDNHNIENIRLRSLRKHVGLVSQDITLFSGTIAENIGYRDLTTKIDMERVKHVAQTAHADEFIRKLPEGYETNIGPRGSTLSGGQRQRLAIARALYQDPSILILDEATSALDSKSELLVRKAVEHLMENRTVLVIAHRLETVMMAKRVFLMDNGKLQEVPRSTMFNGHKDSLLSSGLVI
ncbi:ABC transporter B family member 29, chloroplastic isoform X2 [Arachis stenosperma]|uniref:ABC transporter B family member 29, chloroplastic isoform X2 n=1 Tax=Arachis stenosperma TaxID=217475 RepID=UPI0025AD642B|nr:ABC transporter B family member 29, chloroplastic isoform X2 [Arachis stenosperma]